MTMGIFKAQKMLNYPDQLRGHLFEYIYIYKCVVFIYGQLKSAVSFKTCHFHRHANINNFSCLKIKIPFLIYHIQVPDWLGIRHICSNTIFHTK